MWLIDHLRKINVIDTLYIIIIIVFGYLTFFLVVWELAHGISLQAVELLLKSFLEKSLIITSLNKMQNITFARVSYTMS
jgi:hypothetical protein